VLVTTPSSSYELANTQYSLRKVTCNPAAIASKAPLLQKAKSGSNTTHSICISRNSERSKKLHDDGRLLPKHVGTSIQNKGLVQINEYCWSFLLRLIMHGTKLNYGVLSNMCICAVKHNCYT
jgi:hypothetical protein